MVDLPFVSFCISTYNRPKLLNQQISLLLQQTFSDFEIIISDNDPNGSASQVKAKFSDTRVKYFPNGRNLGMIPSFNMSILRAKGKYIVPVTDDDPVDPSFLSEMHKLIIDYPGFGLYAGFLRTRATPNYIENISPTTFVEEILDPGKTSWMLWSSCLIQKEVAAKIENIPDYGSPHLADHAFIAMAGSIKGGVIKNCQYSALSSHDANFSKFNFEYYIKGCAGFHQCLSTFFQGSANRSKNMKVVEKHLHSWLITCMFNLKSYYCRKKDENTLAKIENCAAEILALPFMRRVKTRYQVKNAIFFAKRLFKY